MAGAVFGEVGGWLVVTGAALRDILGDSRSAKCCILQYKIVSKLGRVRSPKRRVRDDDFILGLSSDVFGLSSDYPRIILESSFYWRKHSGSIRWNLQLQDFQQRSSDHINREIKRPYRLIVGRPVCSCYIQSMVFNVCLSPRSLIWSAIECDLHSFTKLIMKIPPKDHDPEHGFIKRRYIWS